MDGQKILSLWRLKVYDAVSIVTDDNLRHKKFSQWENSIRNIKDQY